MQGMMNSVNGDVLNSSDSNILADNHFTTCNHTVIIRRFYHFTTALILGTQIILNPNFNLFFTPEK